MNFLLELQKMKRRLKDDVLIEARIIINDEIDRRANNDANNLSKVS